MSFTYRKGWHGCFFDCDRIRRQLPRLAFVNSDEAMVEFTRCAGGPKTLEERTIFDMEYVQGMSRVAISRSTGLTPTRVHQIAGKILKKSSRLFVSN